MILGILLCALVLGGANSSFTTNTDPSGIKFPSLNEANIEDLAGGLKYREFTGAYIARTNDVNNFLNAVVEINPDATLIASMLDDERSMGKIRGPLHGIPILIKDVIATNDKLREAGAIILGRTNSSQWGHFRSFNTSNGWSTRGGQTYGPYFPRQDHSGSSSGSAVAAALGLATVCLGAETSGSIIAPAHYNNIVGMKPTVGLTSRHLVVPVSEHMDTIGQMTKNDKDAAYVLQTIAGVDPFDNYTSAILTISMLEAFNKSLAILKSAGDVIIENTDFPSAQESMENGLLTVQVVAADFIVAVEKYLNLLVHNSQNITDLTGLRKWSQSSSLEGYPNKPTDIWDAALENWNNTDYKSWCTYQRALYWGNEGGLLGVIERYKLDAVILPSLFSWNRAAVVGVPIVSVPMGSMTSDQPIVSDAGGLPIIYIRPRFGFSFLGARFTDAKLIGLAYAFERRTMKRKMVHPYIKLRTDLRDVVGMHY
ncbi:hypothetical protein BOTCAL_0523g00020 [Botryotinia calthae]|uniref:Amidase domain-containing protein n=1 Tax=Botryotinia calthae TaxID=38488 RepID=A0A4Y8CMJ0_9HELO|nr:hypothetical protein BOTCAL_0523g00020 [Botryotinia calthae]